MSEQIAVRLPDKAKRDEIDQRAAKVGLSRNQWINRALDWALSQPVTTRTKQERV